MNTIESGVKQLDELKQTAIEKHHALFSKAIFDSASVSNACAKSFDSEIAKQFPELDLMVPENNGSAFNPKTVVEFRDGKAYQVIESWDTTDGILPDRIVQGQYHIDVGQDNTKFYCENHKQGFNDFKCAGCGNKNQSNFSCNDVPSYFTLGCGCHFMQPHVKINTSGPSKDMIRGIDKSLFSATISYSFDVDNYLNLLHKETGLYLMFNKTVFPKFPFYTMKSSKEVFTSKRMPELTPQIMTQVYHKSKDSRPQFLESINQLIPEDVDKVYDFFNRFRNFKSFSHKGEVPLSCELVDSVDADPRDTLVHSYRIRLEETLKKLEAVDRIMEEMVEEYDRKSVEIKTKHLEITQLEQQIQEINASHTKELLIIKSKKEMESIDEIETLKTTNFKYQKRLLEIEKQKAEMDTMGISIDTSKRENREISLKVERLSGMNEKLVTQIRTEKSKIREIENARSLAGSQVLEFEKDNALKSSQIKNLEKELNDKTIEFSSLTINLTQIGQKSSDVLEMALSDNIEKLQEEIESTKNRNKELEIENSSVTKELERMKTTISGLFK